MTQNNQSTEHQQMVQILPSDYMHHDDDSIDLVQLFLNLKKRWKQIFLITFVGTTLSILYALYLPKVYQSTVQVSQPKLSTLTKLEENGLTKFSKASLFKEYYNKIRSENFLKQYLIGQDYLQKLYPEKYSIKDREQLFSGFVKDFEVTIDEPVAAKGEFVENPSRFSLSLQHSNEALLLEIINSYVNNTNVQLLVELKKDQQLQRDSLVKMKQQQIALLRENAKVSRDLLIKKIETNNQQKLNELQQQKQLLIAKAENDRQTQIAKIEESDQQKLNELQQQKQLLITKAENDRKTQIATIEENDHRQLKELIQQKQLLIVKAKEDRLTRIAKTKEAALIAKTLKIQNPTSIDRLTENSKGQLQGRTTITLNDNNSLPLYLMGTKYLTALIKTLTKRTDDAVYLTAINMINSKIEKIKNNQALKVLKERKSDAPFLAQLNKIASDIAKIKNNQALKTLKERKSDAPFLAQLNKIEQSINRIKQDKNLKALKERQSDDPFIAALPAIFNSIATLKAKSFDFTGVKAFTLDKAALFTNKAIKPKRALIVVLGGILSGFIALIAALFSSAMANRKESS